MSIPARARAGRRQVVTDTLRADDGAVDVPRWGVLLTGETSATRALATVLERRPAMTRQWLRRLGVPCDQLLEVRVEEVVRGRRVDIRLLVRSAGEVATVSIEAKLDAPLDVSQLEDARERATHVVSLVPAGIRPTTVPGVVESTWEELLALSRGGPGADEVSTFLADEIARLLSSEAITKRRELAALVPTSLPPRWTCDVAPSSAGGSVLIFRGPSHPGSRQTRLEVWNSSRGAVTPLRAQVLATSGTSATDRVVWTALGRAASRCKGPAPDQIRLGAGGQRTPAEQGAAAAHGVPRSWTYGFGERMLEKWGWAGFGPRFDLVAGDPSLVVEHALGVAVMVDGSLKYAASRDRDPVS